MYVVTVATFTVEMGVEKAVLKGDEVWARVYKRRERECPTSYCCVQTPFAKYRGQYGQHYIKVTTNQYRCMTTHSILVLIIAH